MPDKRKGIDPSKIDEAALREALESNLTEGGRRASRGHSMEVFRGEDIDTRDHGFPAMSVALHDVRVGKPGAGDIVKTAVIGEYVYGILGLVLGLASILGGVVLGLNGVAGNTSLTAKLIGFSIGVNDAVPGVILFVVGAIFIYITRPDVNLKKLR
jgi:hypothetical protein